MSALAREGPLILSRSNHPISRRNIDITAIKVLYRLHHGGFKGCLVGGAVRDLMLERRPKDFDIGTDAKPQQIRRLFRNSRIIGRRFRLAHVYFRDGIVEVATFRRTPDPEAQRGSPGELLITDDNVFGSPEEDAYRRDFTVNALLYDISDFSVVDYVGGISDLRQRLIRTIGDPEIRFQEDPVRMLRACELAGRLDFTIEPTTRASISRHRHEIEKSAPARLSEELVQILSCGSCARVLELACQVGLLEVFLPEAFTLLELQGDQASGFQKIPQVLDSMVASGEAPSDVVLLGSVLLPLVLLRRRDVEALNQRSIRRLALRRLTEKTLEPFVARFALSKLKTEQLHFAIAAFHRFGDRWGSAADRIQFARQPGFDDALALLEVLVAATGEGSSRLNLWRRIRDKRPQGASARTSAGRRRRRRRRGR